MKKKLLSAIASAFALAALLPAVASASPTPAQTDVTGTVTSGTSLVQGASVTVKCNGNTGSDITDNTGTYLVVFSAVQCPKGDTANVTATKGALSGSSSGPAGFITNKLNIAVVDVSIPEFGIAAGVVAAIMGGGAFMVIRRRQLSGHQA